MNLALLERMEDEEDARVARQVLEEYEREPESFISLSGYQRGKHSRCVYCSVADDPETPSSSSA